MRTNMWLKFTGIFLLALFLSGNTCKKSEENPAGPGNQTAIQTINSTSGGTVTTQSGHGIEVIPGTVPPNQSGQSASVSFTIETPVDPPKAVPAGVTLKGNMARIGPDAFRFSWPVKVLLPYPDGTDISTINVIHYNAGLDQWELIPISNVDPTAKKVSCDVLELGYFSLATIPRGTGKVLDQYSDGGFEYSWSEMTTYYSCLTVKSVANWKYPYQQAWYPNILAGASGGSGSTPTGGPDGKPVHIMLPQATYEIWVTKTKPGTLFEMPKVWTYSIPALGTIGNPLTWTLGTATGWTELTLPGGGEWREGRPNEWGTPTTTYGTGDFQATLTWVNTSQKSTDLDLYLEGPNSMKVYFGAKTSADGAFQLDRDFRYTTGNAVENIYSLKPPTEWPRGEYRVKVNQWGGSDNMSYSLRVIRGASVQTYGGTLTSGNAWATHYTFTIQ